MSGPLLKRTYDKLLRALERLPKESEYKSITAQLVKERQKIIQTSDSDEDIEKKLGPCEKLLQQAKHELNLVETMKKYEPWKPLDENPAENQWKWPM